MNWSGSSCSRHLREVLAPGNAKREECLKLSREEEWLDVFFFAIDELDSRAALNTLLDELLGEKNGVALRLVAYALGTKSAGLVRDEVRGAYNSAKLAEDLRRTPMG